MIAKSSQCQLTALATAVLLSMTSLPAGALSLGRITVQSALGEPLQAEIDFLDINAEEAASLNARIASPDAFKAAGLEYNAALSSLRTSLQRRANGRAFLKLSSDKAVNEPFVDLILETTWSSGRIVRDYTLLFDPPKLRSATAQTPDKSQLPALSSTTTPTPQATPSANAVAKPATTPRPATAAPTATSSTQTLRVQAGQTAGQIAAAHLPANVSLDQMLVAMLRSNPTAFIGDNVNRIKAGAVLTLPAPQTVQAIPAEEATQLVVAQSRDFNEFRRKMADNVRPTQTTAASREASGQVQASVQDKKPAPTTPDKLTLSKGSVQGKSGEDLLAKTRNDEQAQARAAELAKNITDLNKLAAVASAPADAAAAKAPTPQASAPEQPASTTAAAPAVTTPAVVQPAPPVSKPAPKAPEPTPEPGFIDTLLDNPMLPAGVVALLGLLAALGFFKSRQRKNDTLLDSAFAESSLADAFTGASGGQSVDTSDSLSSGSSMVYSPSQLDSADDVDPVAEADVYLAYGRDLQAEEILKDALRNTPERVAIHVKLAEIYAKRQDPKALESVATQAFNLTDGNGQQWEQICEKGLSIDPDNALYLPGGQPGFGPTATFNPEDMPESSASSDELAQAKAQTEAVVSRPGALDELDLDLDFSLEEPSDLPDAAPVPAAAPTPVAPAPAPTTDPQTIQGGLDFTEPGGFDPISKLAALHEELPDEMPSAQDSGRFSLELPEPASQPGPAETPAPTLDLAPSAPEALAEPAPEPLLAPQWPTEPALTQDVAAPTLELEPEAPPAPQAAPEDEQATPADAATEQAPKDLMSFDLDSLSLDLAEDRATVPADFVEQAMDPLETKLALAEEFRAIGDDDGARALIEEVISEATGDIKAKAQQALAKL